jgi:hypothetical protein
MIEHYGGWVWFQRNGLLGGSNEIELIELYLLPPVLEGGEVVTYLGWFRMVVIKNRDQIW